VTKVSEESAFVFEISEKQILRFAQDDTPGHSERLKGTKNLLLLGGRKQHILRCAHPACRPIRWKGYVVL
jgi:hypothetical protein